MRFAVLFALLLCLPGCHPEWKAQREATLQAMSGIVAAVEESRLPDPLPEDLSRYGRHADFLRFVHPRATRSVTLQREVEPLIRASMAWMSPRDWAQHETLVRYRREADQLLAVLDQSLELQEGTFGPGGQRAIDAMDVPAPSREAFRAGLRTTWEHSGLIRSFMAAYRERTQAQRDLLAHLEAHLERMDDVRPLFPGTDLAETYRRLLAEERASMARLQERLVAAAQELRALEASQRRMVESMRER